MSGIAGIIHFDCAPVAPGLVEKMTGAMAYRGPDGIGHWVRGNVALGQCMLRTTPESMEEEQPLANEDESVVLVMDGRVDNWEELRRELMARGAVLRDRSDAELVLRAYEAWGDECPDRIIGEFVFFVWDGRKRRLFAARDAAGTRHFYYHSGDRWFAFASEIKGLLALDMIEPRLNEWRLLDYLVVEFDRYDEVGTFYEGIDRMPAGHAMSVDDRGVDSWRYWDPSALPATRFRSAGECEDAFKQTLRDAVKCRLRSTGPGASALSGGLDSSSIVGLTREEFRSELVEPLRTFSLVGADCERCFDWHGIKAMLRDGWIEPTIIAPEAAGAHGDGFIERVGEMDEPFAFSMDFPDTLMWDAARHSGCKFIMDGTAGDLLFLHLRQSLESAMREREFRLVPGVLRAYRTHRLPGGLRAAARSSLRNATPEPLRAAYRKVRRKFERPAKRTDIAGDLRDLIVPRLAQRYIEKRTRDRAQQWVPRGGEWHRGIQALNFTTGSLSFAHEVRGQAAHARAVEPRSPFSDRRMIEFAIRMPLSAKVSNRWYKFLLRNCMAGILPDDIRWRRALSEHPGPQFFGALIERVARSRRDAWSFERLSGTLSQWITIPALKRMWDEHQNSGAYWAGYNLLLLVVLGEWMVAHRLAPTTSG
jgi:asparagine synthase (glutamine-hydrolysing)